MLDPTSTRTKAFVVAAIVLLATSFTTGCDQGPAASQGADEPTAEERAIVALLFREGAGGLTGGDQLDIIRTLGLGISADGAALVDGACGEPASSQVSFEDLDDDGETEVVVDYGNTCWSGMAGTSVTVFVRDGGGHFRPNFGVPGMIAEVRVNPSGYSDLLIGGPGFCFGLWQWNGQEYAYSRSEPQAPDGCAYRGL